MSAQVFLFSDYPNLNPRPTRLYCDTNFLIRLLFYNNNIKNPIVLKQEDIDCFNFYNLIQQNNTELITSVYGFSELMHFYIFNYGQAGLYKVVKSFFQQKNIVLQNMNMHEKYKHFAKNYPNDFTVAFRQIAHRINDADKFLVKIGVKILYPLPSPDLSNISKKIVDYASILMDAFPKLESNDAMHLSIADHLNIPNIISLDDSFKDVDNFTIFARN